VAVDVATELDRFYADVAANDLQPLWTQTRDLITSEPRPRAVPWLWRRQTLVPLMERARELITIERGGERRVLALANPGLDGLPYATPTLWGALQLLGPREKAPAHRHAASAIRFVLEGDGVWTTVDGDACDMHPGDLVLTPSWTFHDHENGGDGSMIWFDGLDLPLVNALDASFYENHPELSQPVVGHNLSEQAQAEGRPVALLVYRWADTDAALTAALEHDGGPSARVEYLDPSTGGAPMATFASEVHRILPGASTPPVRRAGSAVFVVFRGRGHSVIGGTRFDWEQGDLFAVPSWAAVEHRADEPSDLFAVTDAPALRALRLYREEELAAPQVVVGTFVPK
jgi:gentisate 1,2-dioxygenase